jgi:biopolymer transport protein TolR
MGFSAGGGKNSVRSDINVTPLVDVVLVLLIIFLVTMPILMRELDLEIPRKTDDVVEPDMQEAQIVLTVGFDGTLKLNDLDVGKFDLAEKIRDQLKNRRDKIVFVGFDDELKYGEAVQYMDIVKGAGAEKVALKMKDDKDQPAAPGSTGSGDPAHPVQ